MEMLETDKQNKITADVIPSERLFVIRTRGTAVTGGVLAATVNPVLGGVLAAVSPVVEIDNFNELLGTLKRIAGGELGEVNLKLRELKNKVEDFLNDYDKDGNQEIDLEELINERIKFNKELDKVEVIEQAIKELEKEVIKYKKGSIGEEKEETEPNSETQLTALELKLAQRKKERERLEQKKNKLAIQLKELEVDYQQIKKDLSAKQNDLLLLTKNDNEELKSLNQEIVNLKQQLAAAEQEKNNINQQLIKVDVILFSHQIKNLNLGSKINQKEICQGKLSQEIMVENNNSKGKDKGIESQVKDERQFEEEKIEIVTYQKK
ncbi:39494_t:CDS:2 [Gigaspora margarita]|uniref:39494_t:CDS:1 n=1 Tax=Gigaspora margarita TaxID=4874 RepID=A0ABM8VWC9_GIGMA|nr:39494_t:CDS:2 [Gigaspora margarita]